MSGNSPALDKGICQQLMSQGCIGDEVILMFSMEVNMRTLDSICMTLRRIGYCVTVKFYENFTNRKGEGCVEEAIANYLKGRPIPSKGINIVGMRGKNGKQYLYTVGVKYIGSSADGVYYYSVCGKNKKALGKAGQAFYNAVGKGGIAVVDGNGSPHKDKISALNKALYNIS